MFNKMSKYAMFAFAVGISGNGFANERDPEQIITPEILEQHLQEDAEYFATYPDTFEIPDTIPGFSIGDMRLDSFKWHSVLMTGDDSIKAFDNARKKVASMFNAMGVAPEDTKHLSRAAKEQVNGVMATSIANFEKAMKDQGIGEGDACSVFMTSHGTTSGFYIKGQSYLTPAKLNQVLDDACGTQPTIVLVSACYSGVFAEANMQRPNRIILTAARRDRTSFGCSSEAVYTYWDGCLIESLETSDTWKGLSDTINACVKRKERNGSFTPSEPQTRLGEAIADFRIFEK